MKGRKGCTVNPNRAPKVRLHPVLGETGHSNLKWACCKLYGKVGLKSSSSNSSCMLYGGKESIVQRNTVDYTTGLE